MKKIIFLLLAASAVQAQYISFPDANFKAKLLQSSATNGIAKNAAMQPMAVDANGDGQIAYSEAYWVYALDVSPLPGEPMLSNIGGIANFSNLRELNCSGNGLSSVNINMLVNMEELDLSNNHIANLEVTALTNLTSLKFGTNNVTYIDLTTLANLQVLDCSNNVLTSVYIPNSPCLQFFDGSFNNISILDLSGLTALTTVVVDHTLITSLNLSCASNLVTANFGTNPNLTSVYLKNGNALETIDSANTPALNYICADDSQVATIQSYVTGLGYACTVDSACPVASCSAMACTLGNPGHTMGAAFAIFPNPVKNALNFHTDNSDILHKVEVYNLLGQKVLQVSNDNISSIDVSSLKTGNYFLKIHSDKGSTTIKFIKE